VIGPLLKRLRIDPYILLLLGVMLLASLLPARGAADEVLGWVANGAIALLFFLQGARLSREAVISGLSAGRLHLATYALFPGIALAINATGIVPQALRPGLLFLACLPSTVQSSIAFVSVGRGNVAAAVCAASLSNLLAVILTPLLVGLLLGSEAGVSWDTLRAIVLQLLLPFLAGQLARPLIGGFVAKHRTLVSVVDRGSIVLVVYRAFGHAVVGGIWTRVSAADLLVLILTCMAILAIVIAIMIAVARALRLGPAEEVVAVICGSQKSLASGAPMAGLLFAPAAAGMAILPLMVFHQIQLFTASLVAPRYARRSPGAD
jgi:solute carrier family 10 (sodium/bile acid cotransporter), member 7